MSNWIATNELRFVERINKSVDAIQGNTLAWSKRTLQQKWELNDPKFAYQYEWRDVPVVEEE